jgi:hypothetical protein
MPYNCDPCVCPDQHYRDNQSWKKAVITLLCRLSTNLTSRISSMLTTSFGMSSDNGLENMLPGSKGFITLPYNGTITHWYLTADAAGDVTLDIKRGGVSIIGAGNAPALAGIQRANDVANLSWTSKAIAVGDELEFEVTGTPTVKRVNLSVFVTRS